MHGIHGILAADVTSGGARKFVVRFPSCMFFRYLDGYRMACRQGWAWNIGRSVHASESRMITATSSANDGIGMQVFRPHGDGVNAPPLRPEITDVESE